MVYSFHNIDIQKAKETCNGCRLLIFAFQISVCRCLFKKPLYICDFLKTSLAYLMFQTTSSILGQSQFCKEIAVTYDARLRERVRREMVVSVVHSFRIVNASSLLAKPS